MVYYAMPLGAARRAYLESTGQPLPGRPKRRADSDSAMLRIYASASALEWFASLGPEQRGRLVEDLHRTTRQPA